MTTAAPREFALRPTYGKQNVPVFKVRKPVDGRHEICDMIVSIMLEGDVSKSWLTGDNSQILPTETQKNTCYALALQTEFDCIEDYGLALGRDLLRRHLHLRTVRLELSEREWHRVPVRGKHPHNHAFMSSPKPLRRTCKLVVRRDAPPEVTSGVRGVKRKTTSIIDSKCALLLKL